MSFIEGTKSYYRLCGLRGVAAIFTFRLFGFPREVSSIPAGMAHPVHLRTRSTDVAVFLEIFTVVNTMSTCRSRRDSSSMPEPTLGWLLFSLPADIPMRPSLQSNPSPTTSNCCSETWRPGPMSYRFARPSGTRIDGLRFRRRTRLREPMAPGDSSPTRHPEPPMFARSPSDL